MSSKKSDRSRREFLQTVGTGVPTLSLAMKARSGRGQTLPETVDQPVRRSKFTPLDLTKYFNCSSKDFGPHELARNLTGDASGDGLLRPLVGRQTRQGIPFALGPGGLVNKSWLALSTKPLRWAASRASIPVAQRVRFACMMAFCDWDPNETPPPSDDVIEKVGQLLGELVFVYGEGSEKALPIRRRFEVNAPTWGHPAFAAKVCLKDAPRKLTDPLRNGQDWGQLQTVADFMAEPVTPDGRLSALFWISALANPEPEKSLKALRLDAKSEDALLICGITLFSGRENPLRYEGLSLYRFTLPQPTAEEEDRWRVEVDLGVVARQYVLPHFAANDWLVSSSKGLLTERTKPVKGSPHLYAEVTASREATLTLTDTKTSRRYRFDLGQVKPREELEARPAGSRIEILEPQKTWLHGQIIDSGTGNPTPVRLSFRSKDGRYIPPYGHRTEINDAWFQDYGADLKFGDTSFAYVDRRFQVELPVGEVFVEMTKGFEYEPVRRKLTIEPGQRELKLEIGRHIDLRSKGWVTADTHVHFLSPSTAVLEGQAEGVNLVSLLAAQWGDLLTNVGDIPHGPLVSKDGETRVEVSSENRQHLLGHIGLVGGHGDPVFPMSAGWPPEGYLGDPLWNSLAHWSDKQHERGGLSVAVHFPYPNAELPADIALGKIDAVELNPNAEHFNALRFYDWYRYLNCGYRLPCVGGTDKMGAYMAVGANRTYAYLGPQEFNFENWAKAVRSGNTFMTTGPLLLLRADGHMPGEEVTIGGGGATVEVQAEVQSFVPVNRIELVWNGKVIASRDDKSGRREFVLTEKIRVNAPGWLAARCISNMGHALGSWISYQAHTSPVYFKVVGQELFSEPAITYMLTLIEGTEIWVNQLATRPEPESLARVLQTLHDARERLHQRLHAHGIRHLKKEAYARARQT